MTCWQLPRAWWPHAVLYYLARYLRTVCGSHVLGCFPTALHTCAMFKCTSFCHYSLCKDLPSPVPMYSTLPTTPSPVSILPCTSLLCTHPPPTLLPSSRGTHIGGHALDVQASQECVSGSRPPSARPPRRCFSAVPGPLGGRALQAVVQVRAACEAKTAV